VISESNYVGTSLTATDTTTLNYTDAAENYYLGQVTSQLTTVAPNTSAAQSSRRDYNYALYDSAVLTRTDFDIDTQSATLPVTYSTYVLGGHGEVLSATITDGTPRTVNYVEDASGQVIRRRETSGTGTASTATELSNDRWYRFAGVELFESGSVTTGADGIAGSSYTVREGDTLSGIAQALWGDAMLWYKLAEANGLSSPGTPLIPGRTLSVPGGVSSTHHNADTFKPYDTVETLGNTQPGAPAQPAAVAPPRKKGCGIVGQILLVAIAVAVTIIATPAATAALGGSSILGGAAAAVAGSVASQLVGVATGIQDKFSFKQVAPAGGAKACAERSRSRRPWPMVIAAMHPLPNWLMTRNMTATICAHGWPSEVTIAVIAYKRNSKIQLDCDAKIYKQHNVVERMFCSLKDWGKVAKRYDRNIKTFMATIAIAAAVIWWL
jgi:trimeric autotransporter adhesin